MRHDWTTKDSAKAELEVLIKSEVYPLLPDPPFTKDYNAALPERVFQHVLQQSKRRSLGHSGSLIRSQTRPPSFFEDLAGV